MVSFVEKICVLARREIRELGPTASQILFPESHHILLEYSKFVEMLEVVSHPVNAGRKSRL